MGGCLLYQKLWHEEKWLPTSQPPLTPIAHQLEVRFEEPLPSPCWNVGKLDLLRSTEPLWVHDHQGHVPWQETAVRSTPRILQLLGSFCYLFYDVLWASCVWGRAGVGDITEQKPSGSTNCFSIIQASVSRHLGWFRFLTIENRAAVGTDAQVFPQQEVGSFESMPTALSKSGTKEIVRQFHSHHFSHYRKILEFQETFFLKLALLPTDHVLSSPKSHPASLGLSFITKWDLTKMTLKTCSSSSNCELVKSGKATIQPEALTRLECSLWRW